MVVPVEFVRALSFIFKTFVSSCAESDLSTEAPRVVPLTCHGHSRPVVHLHFSPMLGDDEYYLISACKGDLGDCLPSPGSILIPELHR